MNTCDACQHYSHADPKDTSHYPENRGACALIQDINEMEPRSASWRVQVPIDKVVTWDSECWKSSAYVGPKFGCIHWLKKEVTP